MTRLLERKMAEIGDEPMHPRQGDAASLAYLASLPPNSIA